MQTIMSNTVQSFRESALTQINQETVETKSTQRRINDHEGQSNSRNRRKEKNKIEMKNIVIHQFRGPPEVDILLTSRTIGLQLPEIEV